VAVWILPPYVGQVMLRFLDCLDLYNGFARVRCERCYQKLVEEVGEWLFQEMVEAFPHRHAVVSIPKILQRIMNILDMVIRETERFGRPK